MCVALYMHQHDDSAYIVYDSDQPDLEKLIRDWLVQHEFGLIKIIAKEAHVVQFAYVPNTPTGEVNPDAVHAAKERHTAKLAVVRAPHRIVPFKEVRSRKANDCPIVAVANILQIPYPQAHGICFAHGWSSTRGIKLGFLELIMDKKDHETGFRPDLCGQTVSEFAANCPEGVFLVYCTGHVIPAINGTLYNVGNCAGLNVREVFEVHPKTKQLTPGAPTS